MRSCAKLKGRENLREQGITFLTLTFKDTGQKIVIGGQSRVRYLSQLLIHIFSLPFLDLILFLLISHGFHIGCLVNISFISRMTIHNYILPIMLFYLFCISFQSLLFVHVAEADYSSGGWFFNYNIVYRYGDPKKTFLIHIPTHTVSNRFRLYYSNFRFMYQNKVDWLAHIK